MFFVVSKLGSKGVKHYFKGSAEEAIFAAYQVMVNERPPNLWIWDGENRLYSPAEFKELYRREVREGAGGASICKVSAIANPGAAGGFTPPLAAGDSEDPSRLQANP